MSTFLQMTKDWLPSLAVVAGGAWLLLRWLFDERLRARREMPAIDGELKSRILPLAREKVLLVVEANWKNSSPLPILIDTKETRFELYEISEEPPLGPFHPEKDLGAPNGQAFPLADMKDFLFEPGTNNQVRSRFVVLAGKIYCVRAKVYRDSGGNKGKLYAWTREVIIDARKITQEAEVEQAVQVAVEASDAESPPNPRFHRTAGSVVRTVKR